MKCVHWPIKHSRLLFRFALFFGETHFSTRLQLSHRHIRSGENCASCRVAICASPMAEHQQDDTTGGSPNLLGLSFSGRHVYQRMESVDDGGDIHLTDLDSSRYQTPANAAATHLSPNMDADGAVSPSTIHSQEDVSVGDMTVSPVHTLGPEHALTQTPEILLSPALHQDEAVADMPSAAPTPRRVSKKSRFTEMLRRSLSSSWDKRVISGPGFEATRDGSGQASSYRMGSPGTPRDPNYLHPITEYNNTENRDETDNFSLKCSMDRFLFSS